MSKAAEKSKQYRDYREQCGIKDPVMLNEIEEAYFEGYHQAEKDLELMWKDIELIVNIDLDTNHEEAITGSRKNKEHYQEVLKRFKDLKHSNRKYRS